GQIGLERDAETLDGDRLHVQGVIELESSRPPAAEVRHLAFEAEKGRDRKTDFVRIEGIARRFPAIARLNARADEGDSQAEAPVKIRQPHDLVIGAEEQGAEFIVAPRKAVVHDGKLETLTVRRGQDQLLARIEPADLLRRPDALGESRIVEIAGQAEARIEGVVVFQPDVEEIMISVASAGIVINAGLPVLVTLSSPGQEIADLGQGKDNFGLRIAGHQCLQLAVYLAWIVIVGRIQVPAVQRLPRPWRQGIRLADTGPPGPEQIRPV